MEKLLESKLSNISMIKSKFHFVLSLLVQDEQIINLKGMLNQTINVKIKYEMIIKRLLDNDTCKDLTM
jgi:hypothetical protein